MHRFLSLISILFVAFPLTASAQSIDTRALAQRMDKIERDLNVLQRSVARGEALPTAEDYERSPAGLADSEIRGGALDEQIRKLQGMIEEAQHANRQNADQLAKLAKEIDFRLSALESRANSAAPATPAVGEDAAPAPASAVKESEDAYLDKRPADAGEAPAKTAENFATPRDAYNHAFKLLRQAKHVEAGKAFEGFIARYPDDALTGNAYYWLGETYYVQRDYLKAADNYRKGYKAQPAGPKAAENLFKLGVTLSSLEKNKEACVVFGQVLEKFASSSGAVKQKVEQEQARIGCQ